MVLEYFSLKKRAKTGTTPAEAEAKSPVLNAEDEAFLKRITTEQQPDPNTAVVILDKDGTVKGKNAQEALMDGAQEVPLPASPPPVEEGKTSGKKDSGKRNYWTYLQNKVPPLSSFKSTDASKHQAKQQAGDNLQDVANAVKSGESLAPPVKVVTAEEAEEEKQEITSILDRLNLSAVNNRAFSFSKESQKLMDDFTQVLKDLVNGVPTAYDDLEKLLTRSEGQLQGMFDSLPPFIQKLVKSLPAKMTGGLAPGLLAAASDKPGADGKILAAESSAQQFKRRVPSLKKLVTQQGAITAMLRSILNFLKFRFPVALTGTNVILSLAVFILLFVFWYCWKRGRETRLDKERLDAAGPAGADSDGSVSASDLDDSLLLEKPDPNVAKLEAILNRPSSASAPGPH